MGLIESVQTSVLISNSFDVVLCLLKAAVRKAACKEPTHPEEVGGHVDRNNSRSTGMSSSRPTKRPGLVRKIRLFFSLSMSQLFIVLKASELRNNT
jgi:hypothetical protein